MTTQERDLVERGVKALETIATSLSGIDAKASAQSGGQQNAADQAEAVMDRVMKSLGSKFPGFGQAQTQSTAGRGGGGGGNG